MEDLLVLGGGASGLSLALLTGAQVLESGSEPGGHSLSRCVDGYTFDRGPHIMFSRSPFLLQCMINSLGPNVHKCIRNNKVSIEGRLVKYPIENDLASLPPELTVSAMIDYVNSQIQFSNSEDSSANLAEWFVRTFGQALTDVYFRPYNEKVWKTPLERLSMVWAERIPKPPLADVVKSALGVKTEGYLHQLHYHYPRKGGYSSLMNAWATGLRQSQLRLSTDVTRIDTSSNRVRVDTNAGQFEARAVASTIPLRNLPMIVDNMPSQVVAAIGRLRTNATIVVTMGFEGVDHNQWTAVYVPDADFLPNRISYPAVFSPENAPANHFSIQSEIIVPKLMDLAHLSDAEIERHVLDGLWQRGLIPSEAVHKSTYIDRYELAYVVYTNGYESDLELVMNWARENNVHLHGRFGSHNYLNVDGCLEQSIQLSSSLGWLHSEDDITKKFAEIGQQS